MSRRLSGAGDGDVGDASLTKSFSGRVVLAVLGVWFVLAIILTPSQARDAIPLIVAGDVMGSDPDQVYVEPIDDGFELREEFLARACEIIPEEQDCEQAALPFLSPPPALPLVAGASSLDSDLGIRGIRLLGVAAFAAGVIVIWRRLATASPQAPLVLALAIALMTPVVLVSVRLGQTTPFMFTSVVLGVTAMDRPGGRRVLMAVLWSITVAFKAATAAVGVVVLLQRRWRLLGMAAVILAGLTIASVLMADARVLGDFVASSRAVSRMTTVTPHNGSIEGAIYNLPVLGLSQSVATTLGWVVRLALLGAGVLMFRKLRDHDVQWAFAWVLVMVLAPLVWWHYSVVLIGAVAVAIWRTAEPGRWLPILPVVIAAGLPVSVPRGFSVPTFQWLFALACLILVWWLGAKQSREVSSTERTETF